MLKVHGKKRIWRGPHAVIQNAAIQSAPEVTTGPRELDTVPHLHMIDRGAERNILPMKRT